MVVLCCLLSGCGLIDGIADSNIGTYADNRVFLGGDRVTVSLRRDLDQYTCGDGPMVCEAFGSKWECRCSSVAWTSY